MSRNAKRKRQKPAHAAQRQRYDREIHGQGLADFMAAFDDPDLADGAWQAMLEDGGRAYAEEFGVDIDGFDAFHEYLAAKAEQ